MQAPLFTDLLNKEMTRQEFLLHLGLLVFVLTGISGLLKTISDPHLAKKTRFTANSGFGAGPYGG